MISQLTINQLKGYWLKKELKLDCAFYTRKIKTEQGGEFELYLITKGNNKDFQINGHFDSNGNVFTLRLSELFKPEIVLFSHDNHTYKDLVRNICRVIKEK